MKLDFTQTIKDYDDQPILMRPEVPATLRLMAVHALMAQEGGGAQLDVTEVLRRDDLARRIHKADGAIDITTEDAALIKRQIAANFLPMAVASACRLIEGV